MESYGPAGYVKCFTAPGAAAPAHGEAGECAGCNASDWAMLTIINRADSLRQRTIANMEGAYGFSDLKRDFNS